MCWLSRQVQGESEKRQKPEDEDILTTDSIVSRAENKESTRTLDEIKTEYTKQSKRLVFTHPTSFTSLKTEQTETLAVNVNEVLCVSLCVCVCACTHACTCFPNCCPWTSVHRRPSLSKVAAPKQLHSHCQHQAPKTQWSCRLCRANRAVTLFLHPLDLRQWTTASNLLCTPMWTHTGRE